MKLISIGAALIAGFLASPSSAQEVIRNPGYCAQFYPNANCQNYGPGNPYRGSSARRGYWRGSHARMLRPHQRHHKHRYGY